MCAADPAVALCVGHYFLGCYLLTLCCLLQAPPDAILGVTEAFRADTDNRKLNLGVGAYRCALHTLSVQSDCASIPAN